TCERCTRLAGFVLGGSEWSVPRQCRTRVRTLGAGLTHRRDFHQRSYHISDRKPKCYTLLSSMFRHPPRGATGVIPTTMTRPDRCPRGRCAAQPRELPSNLGITRREVHAGPWSVSWAAWS